MAATLHVPGATTTGFEGVGLPVPPSPALLAVTVKLPLKSLSAVLQILTSVTSGVLFVRSPTAKLTRGTIVAFALGDDGESEHAANKATAITAPTPSAAFCFMRMSISPQ